MPGYKKPPPTTIASTPAGAYESLKVAPIAVLCGRNNSGKSFVLRQLLRERGKNASYLGPARYQNFNVLAPYGPRKNRKEEKWQKLLQHLQRSEQNMDNSPLNLQQAIAELSDTQRDTLFQIIDDLLGSKTEIRHTIPDNSMSQKYVSVDDHNLSFTSSGFRLVATLLTSLLDTDYKYFLIDEPELGLSPEVQGVFADWLLDAGSRERYLNHIEGVVLATHSPIFLDRSRIKNNYLIEREGSEISIKQLKTVQDLNRLQFSLLGNRFETLFLPSAILLVEGATDHLFISRLIALRHPNSSVSVIRASGDGRMREVVAIAKQMLGDIRRSPYANRFFVILDAKHGEGLRSSLVKQGISAERILVWDSNGIEHLYPRRVLEACFGSFETLEIEGDRVSANGLELTKRELADRVANQLRADDELPEELESRLMQPLRELLY